MLSLTVKKLHAFKFDGVAESDNTAGVIVPFKEHHGYLIILMNSLREFQAFKHFCRFSRIDSRFWKRREWCKECIPSIYFISGKSSAIQWGGSGQLFLFMNILKNQNWVERNFKMIMQRVRFNLWCFPKASELLLLDSAFRVFYAGVCYLLTAWRGFQTWSSWFYSGGIEL